MSEGNGQPFAEKEEIRRVDQRIDEVESHLPRIGALQHDTIVQASALHRIEMLVHESNINTNNLRHELAARERVRETIDNERWMRLETLMASIAAGLKAA